MEKWRNMTSNAALCFFLVHLFICIFLKKKKTLQQSHFNTVKDSMLAILRGQAFHQSNILPSYCKIIVHES